MSQCVITGCDKEAHCVRLCNRHYKRLHKYGSTDDDVCWTTLTQSDPRDRILAASTVDENGCWIWNRHTDPGGYGSIWWDGRLFGAHRLSYLVFRGDIPAGLECDHLCRVRRCVNPFHLEAVTRRTNILRGGGAAALRARSQICPNGHEYTEENTAIRNGVRVCERCRMERRKRFNATRQERRRLARMSMPPAPEEAGDAK